MARRKKNTGIYRSRFEQTLTDLLRENNVPHEYETLKLNYIIPESKHTYTPDVILPNGVIVEAKGYMDATTRKKMELVIAQNPTLDIRFVFQNPRCKIRKGSKTDYAMWCFKKGFRFGTPKEVLLWASEPKRK